jgi:hypothetical protein
MKDSFSLILIGIIGPSHSVGVKIHHVYIDIKLTKKIIFRKCKEFNNSIFY